YRGNKNFFFDLYIPGEVTADDIAWFVQDKRVRQRPVYHPVVGQDGVLDTLRVVDTFSDLLVLILNFKFDHLTFRNVVRYDKNRLQLIRFVKLRDSVYLHHAVSDL